jgi:hypothetical protein
MKTFDEIKQEVAINAGYEDLRLLDGELIQTAWDTLMSEILGDSTLIEKYMKTISISYAKQSLDLATEEAYTEEVWPNSGLDSSQFIVDKESILKLKDQLK